VRKVILSVVALMTLLSFDVLAAPRCPRYEAHKLLREQGYVGRKPHPGKQHEAPNLPTNVRLRF
jgi:hypothetical protein